MKPVKVGLLGLGTVGGGTHQVLMRNAEEINRRAGRRIEVVSAAVRRPERHADVVLPLSTDPFELVRDPDIDVVVELIGGIEPARQLILEAIAQGKHVVTANKALVALHGNEIFAAAHQQGVMVAFEAAVAGGIPIIKALREGLAGNQIEWLAGIINGTSNFILTEMRDKGRDFADVLAEAQALGYAEADPTFDIEGIDAAHKLTILASIAFGIPLAFDKVYTEGIAHVSRDDVQYAEEFGYIIKHLGIARRVAEGIELRVHPTLIPERRLIANVNGVMNAILVKGDAVGSTLYYGAGAGAEPTASAVVADLVDVVRTLTADPGNRVPHLAFQADHITDLPLLPIDQVVTAYYLHMQAEDRPGVMAEITGVLADQGISIEALIQKKSAPGSTIVPVIMLTHRVREERLVRAVEQIEAMEAITGTVTRIRLERLNAD